MKLEKVSPTRFEFSHSGETFTRYVRYFLIAVVLIVAFGALTGGNFVSLVIVLLVAGLFWKLADYVNVESRAGFDLQMNRFELVQSRAGTELVNRSEPLESIGNAIIESSSRSGKGDDSLKTRPAVVIDGETVPLTFASFVSGPQPTEIAMALRDFLQLPESDLIDDSIAQALKGPVGIGPAVRLARLGKGMGRLDAARYVENVKQEMSSERSDRDTPGGHDIRRERS